MRHANFSCTALLLCLTAFSGSLSWADTDARTVRPLYSFNQSPLIQIYGLPALGESWILGPDESALAIHLQIANHFTGVTINTETLNLDGETRRLALHWRQGLPGGKEWGFELPYIFHNGGFLDSYVVEFHDLFGLQQNGRAVTPRNKIDFRYSRDGVDLVTLNRAVDGPGDVRLFAGKPISPAGAFANLAAAWRVSLKLPTGDDAELLGSGSTDLATWMSLATTRPADKWNLYGGGGLLVMSEGKVLPAQQRTFVGFGTLGISQRFFPQLTVNAQLDIHSPFYSDSRLKQLGKYTAVGLLGIRWEFETKKFIEFSVSEDLVVGASPDVAFNLSLTLPF